MASYMATFRARLSKMQQQGFVIPKYILNIKLEKTARKYTYEKIAQKSKYREIYKGKERLISGEAGLERRRSESARKAVETKKRKEKDRERDFWSESPGGWEIPESGNEVEEWEDRKNELDRNINAIFDSFVSVRLANMLRSLFNKRSREDGDDFWQYLLDHSESVISDLQKDAEIQYYDTKSQDESYNRWTSFLNYGTAPTLNERKENATLEEEDSNEETV